MNKRSAIALAGGVTGALVSGVAGYSLSLNQAAAQTTAPAPKPIVKTEIRTITIHKKAKAPKVNPAAPASIVIKRAPAHSSSYTPPAHHTGGSAHHGEGDDGGEGGGDD